MSIYRDLTNAAISAASRGEHKLALEIDEVQMELTTRIRDLKENLTSSSMQDLNGCWVRALKLADKGFQSPQAPRVA